MRSTFESELRGIIGNKYFVWIGWRPLRQKPGKKSGKPGRLTQPELPGFWLESLVVSLTNLV